MCTTARFRHRPLQRKLSDCLGYLLSNTLPGLLPHVDVLVLLGLLLPGGLLQVLGYNVRVGLGELLRPLLLLVLLGEEVVEIGHGGDEPGGLDEREVKVKGRHECGWMGSTKQTERTGFSSSLSTAR